MVLGLYRAAQYNDFFVSSKTNKHSPGVFSPKQKIKALGKFVEERAHSASISEVSPLATTQIVGFSSKLCVGLPDFGTGSARPVQGISASTYNTRVRFAEELVLNPYGNESVGQSRLLSLSRQVGYRVAGMGLLAKYTKAVTRLAEQTGKSYQVAGRLVLPFLQKIDQSEITARQKQYFRSSQLVQGRGLGAYSVFTFRSQARRPSLVDAARKHTLRSVNAALHARNRTVRYSTSLYFRHSARFTAFPAFFYMNHHKYYLAQRKIRGSTKTKRRVAAYYARHPGSVFQVQLSTFRASTGSQFFKNWRVTRTTYSYFKRLMRVL